MIIHFGFFCTINLIYYIICLFISSIYSNAAYGSTLIQKTKFTQLKNVKGTSNAKLEINSNLFKSLNPLGDDYYEIELGYQSIEMSLPIYIGIQILALAKRRLLEFQYDFVDKYIDRIDRSPIITDTDSIYYSFSNASLLESIKPEFKNVVLKQIYQRCGNRDPNAFLCRKCCSNCTFLDEKYPLLFKLEFKAKKIIALCSKTYVAEGVESHIKLSSKGVNKFNVMKLNPLQLFHNVLKDQQSRCATNNGFRVHNNEIYTYSQLKVVAPFLYIKREVLNNSIFTKPLSVLLEPHPKNYFCIQTDAKILSPDFKRSFKFSLFTFSTIRQAFVYMMYINSDVSDVEIGQRIMNTTSNKDLIKIEKSMNNGKWDKVKYLYMENIVLSRLEELIQCKASLLFSGTQNIVNADRYDNFFGSGIDACSMRWIKSGASHGKNMLGEIYMKKRKQLLTS